MSTNRADKLKEICEYKRTGVIDCHSHSGVLLYNFYKLLYPSLQSLEDLFRKMDKEQVNWSICFPMSSFFFSVKEMFMDYQLINSGMEKIPFEIANKYFLMEVRMFGDRILPFINFNPTLLAKQQCAQIVEWSDEFGLYGLKLPTTGNLCSALDLLGTPFVSLAEKFNWPIMVHSGRDDKSDPMNILKFSERHSDIRICAAHSARYSKDFWDKVKFYRNVFVDISPFLLSCSDNVFQKSETIISLDFESPAKVIDNLFDMLPDRLLWGTDEPWTKIVRDPKNGSLVGASYELEKKFLDSLSFEVREAIAWKNPKKFLGIEC